MKLEMLKMASQLAEQGKPYVLAVVVRRQGSASAELGNTAIFLAEGDSHGWLGGSCIHATVARHSSEVLAGAGARLLSFSPDPSAESRPGITAVPMPCERGGSVDVYLEAIMPPARLLLFGDSPVIRALARLGRAMDHEIHIVNPNAEAADFADAHRVYSGPEDSSLAPRGDGRPDFAVVATMGERDEESILAALKLDLAYLAVVASKKRFAGIRETVLARGADEVAVDKISNPAGLEIGARSADEIALSILAEMVQQRAARDAAAS